MTCPQCGSKWCGPVICRFTAIAHKAYRESQAANVYADVMSARDQGARHEGRPDHDTTTSGLPLKAGK